MSDSELLYARRNDDGEIIGISEIPQDPDDLPISPDDPALKQFLSESDTSMARVVEDVVDLLIEKNLIRFTDLPESARLKMLERRNIRSAISENYLLLDEDNIL